MSKIQIGEPYGMKIAHFIDSDDPGGAETLVIELCTRLNRDGFDTQVWHFGNQWIQEKCEERKIPCLRVPGHRFYKSIVTLPLFVLLFVYFIVRSRIDLLHSHLTDSVIAGSAAAFLCRVPHVGTLHDTYSLAEKKSKASLLRIAALLGTRLITVSVQMREYLERMGQFPTDMIQVIVNGVDLDRFSGAPARNIRSLLGVGQEDVLLISVGRLVKLKGYDTLIAALGDPALAVLPVKLFIVGDGPDRQRCQELIEHGGLGERVVLLGHRDDVQDLLKSSDCFVLASSTEGLSCSIIEAMAAGLPVVATAVGGNAELVMEGVSGFLVPPDNPTALAFRLNEMVLNEEKRRQFGQAGLALATQGLSLSSMVKKYVSIYDSY